MVWEDNFELWHQANGRIVILVEGNDRGETKPCPARCSDLLTSKLPEDAPFSVVIQAQDATQVAAPAEVVLRVLKGAVDPQVQPRRRPPTEVPAGCEGSRVAEHREQRGGLQHPSRRAFRHVELAANDTACGLCGDGSEHFCQPGVDQLPGDLRRHVQPARDPKCKVAADLLVGALSGVEAVVIRGADHALVTEAL